MTLFLKVCADVTYFSFQILSKFFKKFELYKEFSIYLYWSLEVLYLFLIFRRLFTIIVLRGTF